MRNCILLVLMIGCGDDSSNNNTPIKDMAVPIQKDLSGLNTTCDITKQDCASGKKCIAMIDQTGAVTGGCVADGTVAVGATCQSMATSGALNDNCQAGSVCDDLFQNQGLTCHKICTVDTDCASGEQCGDFLSAQGLQGAPFGWCAKTCVAFSTAAGNCAAGLDCGENYYSFDPGTDPNNPAGFFFCKKTGAGAAYATCNTDADCGANLWCGFPPSSNNGVCIPNCDNTTMCVMPTANDAGLSTADCVPYAGTPNGAGFCNVM